MSHSLSHDELHPLHAYWRAANYLSVGQIYLLDNPLLKEPLRKEHIKPRLLGHWGTTPGLNFIYAHLNRIIKKYDLSMIYVTGPGHGGPGLVANSYLEGTYTEHYPSLTQDEIGMRRLFKQFSFPGGIPSHVAPETPGSIHEGGELGYALSHAFGAAFDNPDLIVACVIGDGEAETGPLATSWHSNKFLNPVRDGAVLPILHLNGYKIASPTVLARISHEELDQLLRGYGYTPHYVEGDDPETMHQLMAAALDQVAEEIQRIAQHARANISSDFREVEAAATTGHRRAELAIDLFADRIRATIGALAVTLGGVDALIFTAGIGQHSATLRSRVCNGLQCLQLLLDESKNQENERDGDIAQMSSPARILVIQTQEERWIARAAHYLAASAQIED